MKAQSIGTQIRMATIQTLKEYGRPVNSKSVWYRVQKSVPETPLKKVQDCLYYLVVSGKATRVGNGQGVLYQIATPANGTPLPIEHKPRAVRVAPEVITVEAVAPTPVLEPVKPLQVGQYTINPLAWICADDQGSRLELFTTALEIDQLTKHPKSKKLIFEGNEQRLVRAWLANQAGSLIPQVDVSGLERERDTALELATQAEQRAQAAEDAIAAIRKTLGGGS